MSQYNLPPGVLDTDSSAPWNEPNPTFDYGQCPRCESRDTFEAKTKLKGKYVKVVRFVCRNCWKKFE